MQRSTEWLQSKQMEVIFLDKGIDSIHDPFIPKIVLEGSLKGKFHSSAQSAPIYYLFLYLPAFLEVIIKLT